MVMIAAYEHTIRMHHTCECNLFPVFLKCCPKASYEQAIRMQLTYEIGADDGTRLIVITCVYQVGTTR